MRRALLAAIAIATGAASFDATLRHIDNSAPRREFAPKPDTNSTDRRKSRRTSDTGIRDFDTDVSYEPKLKHGPVLATRHSASPKAEEAQRFEERIQVEYHAFSKAMHGVHVEKRGREAKHYPSYEEFCRALAKECDMLAHRQNDKLYHSVFSPEVLKVIVTINEKANKEIRPITDIQQYGVIERWRIPYSGAGDCEDYVLLKFLRLVEAGFDPARLHILVVLDEKGEGHAVLGVDVYEPTTRQWNTLILDNKRPDIITLEEMGKHYRGMHSTFATQDASGKWRVQFFRYVAQRATPE